MSLAPSFSPPCFYTYGNNNQQQQQLHQTHYHSPQPQYNHSFSAERRRRVTLLHAPKNQLSKTNHFTTITTAIPKQQPQQQEQQNNNNNNKKPLSTSINKKKKVVRFYDDDKLEDIRLFLKTQKPSAIRDGDPALSLDLKYPNWPAKTTMSMRHLPMIRMESVQALISQQTTLIGRCRVANLAFEKHVVVRYTTDYWQSFHETAALYREPIGSSCNTWDRFTFLIDLEEFFIRRRDTTTTIYLALRYTVNEKEYWDNNDGLNYQIDIIPTTLHEDDNDNDKEATDSITTTIENKSTQPSSLAAIEKEGQALHRGNIQNKKSIKQQEQPKKHPHQQKKSITSNTASSTVTTTTAINTITTATTTTTTTSSIPKTTVNNTKKKLGHRYDFGASLSEAKKTPYDVYQFGKGPMLRFSTLTKQEEDGKDGLQSGYHDFVNKYCFYGTNYSSPGSSPSSSLSCPSSEPICG
ncbi:putative phosphatase regulatory subunit-domain-containing protein [Circinella umbellata]|nr:putative phosphatase regulatory subunit-domain-containing protein [Circinella umbellata]